MMESQFEAVYTDETRKRIEHLVGPVKYYPTVEAMAADKDELKAVKYVFSGWGMAEIDCAFLDLLPELEVVYYSGAR